MPNVVITPFLDPIHIPEGHPLDEMDQALQDIQRFAEGRLLTTAMYMSADLRESGLSPEGQAALIKRLEQEVEDALKDPLAEKAYSIRFENPGLSIDQFDALTDDIHGLVMGILQSAKNACVGIPETTLPPKFSAHMHKDAAPEDDHVQYSPEYSAYTLLKAGDSVTNFVKPELYLKLLRGLGVNKAVDMTQYKAKVDVSKMTRKQVEAGVQCLHEHCARMTAMASVEDPCDPRWVGWVMLTINDSALSSLKGDIRSLVTRRLAGLSSEVTSQQVGMLSEYQKKLGFDAVIKEMHVIASELNTTAIEMR